MEVTMSRNQGVMSTVISQTYGLLAMGLILATITAASSLNTVLSLMGMIGICIGSLVLMIVAMWQKENVVGLLCYFGFTGLMGYMAGPAVQHYLSMPNGSTIVMQALGTTAFTTIGLSLYALVSGKSFNRLGGFLFVGLIAIIIAGIVNMFVQSSMMGLIIACVSALIFCGYILYDTSRILSGEITSPVHGAVSMFLNVFNLFFDLLKIFGSLSSSDD